MSHRLQLTSLALLSLLCAVELRALDWESTTSSKSTLPFQKILVLDFHFQNHSANLVQIQDIQTNCDCIEATTDKKTYTPGEKGVLHATFTVGERYGRYERTITVTASDSPSPSKLTTIIESLEPAVPKPRVLEWAIGSAGDEKIVDIESTAPVHLEFTEFFALNEQFRIRLVPVEAGVHYRLYIKPVSTAGISNTAVRVVGHDQEGHQVVVSAYANVR